MEDNDNKPVTYSENHDIFGTGWGIIIGAIILVLIIWFAGGFNTSSSDKGTPSDYCEQSNC